MCKYFAWRTFIYLGQLSLYVVRLLCAHGVRPHLTAFSIFIDVRCDMCIRTIDMSQPRTVLQLDFGLSRISDENYEPKTTNISQKYDWRYDDNLRLPLTLYFVNFFMSRFKAFVLKYNPKLNFRWNKKSSAFVLYAILSTSTLVFRDASVLRLG